MAADGLVGMDREKMWVERPSGTHLSQSRTAGALSALVRSDDSNKLETHATLFPVDDEDEDEPSAPASGVALVALGVAVGVAGTLAVIKAAPHVKSRLNDLTSKWRGRGSTEDGAVGRGADTVSIPSSRVLPVHSSGDADIVP